MALVGLQYCRPCVGEGGGGSSASHHVSACVGSTRTPSGRMPAFVQPSWTRHQRDHLRSPMRSRRHETADVSPKVGFALSNDEGTWTSIRQASAGTGGAFKLSAPEHLGMTYDIAFDALNFCLAEVPQQDRFSWLRSRGQSVHRSPSPARYQSMARVHLQESTVRPASTGKTRGSNFLLLLFPAIW